MIEERHDSLFDSGADALVNTVNCVGVMGKGLALEFRIRYPEMFRAYKKACEAHTIQVGVVTWWSNDGGSFRPSGLPKYILNFPTKEHWRNPSQLTWIDAGLTDLVAVVRTLKVKSLAVPALGCSNGGLHWVDVEPLIRRAFVHLHGVRVFLYPPKEM